MGLFIALLLLPLRLAWCACALALRLAAALAKGICKAVGCAIRKMGMGGGEHDQAAAGTY